MIRIVLDTNVLVVSLIQSAGVCARLLDLVVDGAVEACVDDRILAEYGDVLLRHPDPDVLAGSRPATFPRAVGRA